MRSLATLSFFPARFAGGPNHALSPIASFLSRLSLGKVAELERPRRHPKAFGIPSNLLTGTPSSVPCPRSDACRAKGVPSMCDYSLHLVASRAAKVGDELVTTKFNNSITRGFAAIGEPNVAVCLLPGTEVAFEKEVEFERILGSSRDGSSRRRWLGSGRSTRASRARITMRWSSPTGRPCCSPGCAKASTRPCCSCRLLRAL